MSNREQALSLSLGSNTAASIDGAEFRSGLAESGELVRLSLVPRREDFTLATGAAGHALVYGLLGAALDLPGWIDFARGELASALLEVTARPVNCGLFTGLTGVAFAFAQLHALGVVSAEAGQFEALDGFIGTNLPAPDSRVNVDLVSGLAGIGFYMLARPRSRATEIALTEITNRLAHFLPVPGAPPPLYSPFGERTHYRGIDIGIAHGIAGPLALLNATRHRVRLSPELDRRRAALNDWLAGCMRGPGRAILFPSFETPGEADGDGRNAWCYGALGIAIALANAGEIPGRHAVAEVLARLDQVPTGLWNLNGPGLCHGRAGAAIFEQVLRVRLGMAPKPADPRASLLHDLGSEQGMLGGSPGVLLAHASAYLPGLRSHWMPLFGVSIEV